MSNSISLLKLAGPCVLITAAVFSSCSGGGSSSSSGSSSAFSLLDTNVKNNSTWQINRPMQFKFSRPVDFSSVNLNTITISEDGGGPATGEFQVGTQAGSTPGTLVPDPTIVVFQPACPKLADYSDAGLLPGGFTYTIDIKSGVVGIRSTSGDNLSQEQTISITTPNSNQASVLFLDPQIGPPLPRIYDPTGVPPLTTNFSYVEVGGDPDPDHGQPFTPPSDPNLGSPVPGNFLAPLNLYSDASTGVAVVLELNQPVNPSDSNVNPTNIKFEYLSGADPSIPGNWTTVPHDVTLVANCTTTGARVRITPIGILPQGRTVRVVLTSDFKDLVSDSNPLPIVVGSFVVSTAFNPGTTTPGIAGDEFFEPFDVGGTAPASFEDTTNALTLPRANWGNGQLAAAFAFGGTGGPNGVFDWQVGDDTPTATVAVTLDTTFTLITSADQTLTESVINGVVDVRNFTIKPNGRLTIQGPNPCKILASGVVTINGQLIIRGTNSPGVNSFDTTNISEPGAAGQAGGGRGGDANSLTTQSTPIGQAGFGAFNSPGGGGGGGETGYSLNGEDGRRGAGGGGGVFGHDVTFTQTTFGAHTCPDQSVIGLDAEPGFPGPPGGNGAIHAPGTIPLGGSIGPGPFFDLNSQGQPNTTNDFWGTMLTHTQVLIQGELIQPWAGAGGGGGGNACDTDHFPTTPFSVTGDEKGAGGGGGGGSLTILALGNITIGQTATTPPQGFGYIDAGGGTGGGGENTNGNNHLGGGSGGGSGGHVILQTASNIDFSHCTSTTIPPGGIYAVGGQGGEGFLPASQVGGGGALGGLLTPPAFDALPASMNPAAGNVVYTAYPSSSAPCPMVGVAPSGAPAGAPPGTVIYPLTNPNTLGDADPVHFIVGAGGDGGPGLIQLHVAQLTNIKKPTTAGQSFYKILKPPPVGTQLTTINLPSTSWAANWDQLLPIFGPKSQAQSKWIPLGAASVDPVSNTPKVVDFYFNGTDPTTGKVNTTGTGAQATIPDLPSLFSTALVLHAQSDGILPYIDPNDFRTVVFDSTLLIDDIYTRNPSLVDHFNLKFTQSSTSTGFDVGSATFDEASHRLHVTVSNSGIPLQGFHPGDGVDLLPRFFRVTTQGVLDSLPQSPGAGQPGSTIVMEFQATSATVTGTPDETSGVPSLYETDISRLSNTTVYPMASNFRFFRFRITFDLLSGQGQLSSSIPVPALQFFRMPFKF
jgi:hypothetical protein